MVRAWYMVTCSAGDDPRLEHQLEPARPIDLPTLQQRTGVQYIQLNVDTYTTDGILDKIKKERGYTYEDEMVCSKACLPNYEEKLKTFFTEHLHTDEEIRFILDGSGYFDVRDKDDDWIRIAVSAGDMLIIPSGIYHRFTLDTKNYIRAKRFFVGEPVWLPHNRPADHLPCREQYLQELHQGLRESTL